MSKNNIWHEMYGTRSNDFIDGVIAGVKMFAKWKDGKQYVGIIEYPLEYIIKEIKEGLGYCKE